MSARDPIRIGVVGGSGLYDLEELVDREDVTLTTPFGAPSAPYVVGTLDGQRWLSFPAMGLATGCYRQS